MARFRPTGAAFLAVLYFFSNALFAHAAESTFWADRRHALKSEDGLRPGTVQLPPLGAPLSLALSRNVADRLPVGFVETHGALFNALPASLGTIRGVSLPVGARPERIVLHIQDVHMNAEAQANIAGALRALIGARAAGFVGLEGAFAPVDVRRYRVFGNQAALRRAADWLLRQERVSGPGHVALTDGKDVPFAGVDDAGHHAANVAAYRRAAPRAGTVRAALAAQRKDLERRKAAVFNPALKAFDERVQAYRDGKGSFGDYVRAVSPAGGDAPDVRTFLKALAAEENLDFKKVEAERVLLVESLLRRLSRPRIDALVRRSADYRLGRVRYADFYRELRELCADCGQSLSEFPAMDAYVRYVLLADAVSAEGLFAQSAAMEKSLYAGLARTAEEKSLVAASRLCRLRAGLADFSLTPSDWLEYRSLRAAAPAADLSDFEAFYEEAQARDEAMAANLLAHPVPAGTAAVLVTGGYHAPGVTERLTRAGCAVVSFVPALEKADLSQGSAYLGVFAREKTPLEKLFQGQKLFLSPRQFPPEQTGLEIPADVVLAEAVGPGAEGDPQKTFESLSDDPRRAECRVSVESADGGVRETVSRGGDSVVLDGAVDGEGNLRISESPAPDSWFRRLSRLFSALRPAHETPGGRLSPVLSSSLSLFSLLAASVANASVGHPVSSPGWLHFLSISTGLAVLGAAMSRKGRPRRPAWTVPVWFGKDVLLPEDGWISFLVGGVTVTVDARRRKLSANARNGAPLGSVRLKPGSAVSFGRGAGNGLVIRSSSVPDRAGTVVWSAEGLRVTDDGNPSAAGISLKESVGHFLGPTLEAIRRLPGRRKKALLFDILKNRIFPTFVVDEFGTELLSRAEVVQAGLTHADSGVRSYFLMVLLKALQAAPKSASRYAPLEGTLKALLSSGDQYIRFQAAIALAAMGRIDLAAPFLREDGRPSEYAWLLQSGDSRFLDIMTRVNEAYREHGAFWIAFLLRLHPEEGGRALDSYAEGKPRFGRSDEALAWLSHRAAVGDAARLEMDADALADLVVSLPDLTFESSLSFSRWGGVPAAFLVRGSRYSAPYFPPYGDRDSLLLHNHPVDEPNPGVVSGADQVKKREFGLGDLECAVTHHRDLGDPVRLFVIQKRNGVHELGAYDTSGDRSAVQVTAGDLAHVRDSFKKILMDAGFPASVAPEAAPALPWVDPASMFEEHQASLPPRGFTAVDAAAAEGIRASLDAAEKKLREGDWSGAGADALEAVAGAGRHPRALPEPLRRRVSDMLRWTAGLTGDSSRLSAETFSWLRKTSLVRRGVQEHMSFEDIKVFLDVNATASSPAGLSTEEAWMEKLVFWRALYLGDHPDAVKRERWLANRIRDTLMPLEREIRRSQENLGRPDRGLIPRIYRAVDDVFAKPNPQPLDDGNHRTGTAVITYFLLRYWDLIDRDRYLLNYENGEPRNAVALFGPDGAERTTVALGNRPVYAVRGDGSPKGTPTEEKSSPVASKGPLSGPNSLLFYLLKGLSPRRRLFVGMAGVFGEWKSFATLGSELRPLALAHPLGFALASAAVLVAAAAAHTFLQRWSEGPEGYRPSWGGGTLSRASAFLPYALVPFFPGWAVPALIAHLFYDAYWMVLAGPVERELAPDLQRAVEECLHAGSENRRDIEAASLKLLRRARPFRIDSPTPVHLIIGRSGNTPIRAKLPGGYFPEGLEVSFIPAGRGDYSTGVLMLVSGTDGNERKFWTYDLVRPDRPDVLQPTGPIRGRERLLANLSAWHEVRKSETENNRRLPVFDPSRQRLLNADTLAPMVVEDFSRIRAALQNMERALEDFQYNEAFTRTVLQTGSFWVEFDMVFHKTGPAWAFDPIDAETVIRALGLTPRGPSPRGPRGRKPPSGGGAPGGGGKVIPFPGGKGRGPSDGGAASAALARRARADADRLLAAARNGGVLSERDLKELLLPRAERLDVGLFAASLENAVYRKAFEARLRDGALPGGVPSPGALLDAVLGRMASSADLPAASAGEQAPVLRILESLASEDDESAVLAQMESVKTINAARGQRVLGLRVVVREEAFRARLEAAVRREGLSGAVWIRRVEAEASALGADFAAWRSEAGLEDAALRLSFSISAGITVSSEGVTADSPYVVALLEALKAFPPRPMDFGNALAVLAAVGQAA
jgi:hypothetical protein